MRLCFSLCLLAFTFSCNDAGKSHDHHGATGNKDHKTDFQKMQWLVGSWKGMADTTPFYEAWRKVNDTLIENYAIEIKGSDTVVTAAGSPLNVHDGEVHLGLKDSTRWVLTSLSDDEIILKNDTLKYSNVITWKHTKDDHWYTTLKHPNSTVNYDLVRMPVLERFVDSFVARRK